MKNPFSSSGIVRTSFLLGLGILAVLTIAQTLPPSLPPRQLPKIGTSRLPPNGWDGQIIAHSTPFSLGNQKYVSTLVRAQARQGAGWKSPAPLPVTFPEAEAIARAELRKLVPDDSGWSVSEFRVSRAEDSSGWYLAVTLEPNVQVTAAPLPPDSATVLIDFNGTAGRISRVADHQ